MKLAMSNIGWEQHDDPSVLAALTAHGVTGIEVAPTKVWPDWIDADAEHARAYRSWLQDQGFAIPAMQAILFGRPELSLFDTSAGGVAAMVAHITRVAELAQALGATALVYGAPKSRKRGSRSHEEALEIAGALFSRLGAICAAHDTRLCIEPNPPEYGCDFITNAADALTLVERVASPGFGLHLDAAALHMAGEELAPLLARALPWLCHYHISEPGLSGFVAAEVPHTRFLRSLGEVGYGEWLSIEVDAKKHELSHTLAFVQSALTAAQESRDG